MVHLDTSALVAALTGEGQHLPTFERLIADGARLGLSSLVLYEWWRGPRLPFEIEQQELLLPSHAAVPFGVQEATIAATLFRRVTRARQRRVDIAIAACAISHGAALWTLNPRDFADIPGLELF